MKSLKILLLASLVLLMLCSVAISQTIRPKVGNLTSKGFRWIEIKGDDTYIYSFRINRKTHYIYHRHFHKGDRIKIEYYRDPKTKVDIAHTVTLLSP
jgi:hypothetical protein